MMIRSGARMRRLVGSFGVALGVLCLPVLAPTPSALGQGSFSSVSGQVLDTAGAGVSQARVTLRNTDLGTERSISTSLTGAFRVEGLVSGSYIVEARGSGMITRKPTRLTLTLRSSQVLRLHVEPAAVKQSATVTGRRGTVEGNTTAPAPNTTEASLSTFLPGLTLTYLPNRNRDFTQFTALTAGANEDEDGTGVILNGQRSDDLLTELDGISFVSPLFGGARGAEDRTFFLPLTAVREFELVRTGADAATGRTTAGLINLLTKSGANRPRGEAFYTGRAPALTSVDAFGHSLDNVQNAFGGSYGGALHHDRSFYFASIEKDFLHAPYFTQFDPQPASTSLPAALAVQQAQVVERQSPLAGFGRLDFNLDPSDTLSLEVGANRVRSNDVGDGLTRSMATLAYACALGGQSFTTRAGLTSAFGGAFNSAVVAWGSDHRQRTPNSLAPEVYINGFGVLGGDSAGEHRYTSARTQILDDLTISRGRNALTLGGNLAVDPSSEQKELNRNGRFDYNSLAAYLANAPRRFQQTFVTGDVRYLGTVTLLGVYANARLPLGRSLFLTTGLRWDGQWNPQPLYPNAALIVSQRVPHDLQQWQPRLGLAWNPASPLVVRLSAGLYAAPTPATFFHRPFAENGTQTLTVDSYFDPGLLLSSGGMTGSPHAFAAPPAGLSMSHAMVSGIASGFRNPVSAQVAASVDQQLLPKLGVTLGYVHNSTWALGRQVDRNLSPPTVASDGTALFVTARPLTGYGRVLVEESTAHSTYDGGSLAVNAPLSRRSQLLANYTFARTRDDDSSSGTYSPVTAVNPFDLRAESAYSNLDVRQSLKVNAIFNLPVGLKLNPLLQARSGLPYTPIVGFDRQGDANDSNDRALVNGRIAPRNSQRQPAFANLDFRLVKDFTLKGEGHHLDLFMDVFNIAGFSNRRFGPDAVSVFGDAANPVFSAGQALFAPGVARFGGPREIQFTARLVGF